MLSNFQTLYSSVHIEFLLRYGTVIRGSTVPYGAYQGLLYRRSKKPWVRTTFIPRRITLRVYTFVPVPYLSRPIYKSIYKALPIYGIPYCTAIHKDKAGKTWFLPAARIFSFRNSFLVYVFSILKFYFCSKCMMKSNHQVSAQVTTR